MDLTRREKGIWITLVTQLIVSITYFVELHRGVVTIFILLHIILGAILLQIVLQAVLAIMARNEPPEPRDERDIAIDRIAFRNAYRVLVAAIGAGLVALTVSVHIESHRHLHLNIFQAMNHLIFFLVVAEIARLASQLFLYRRAA